MAELVIEVTRRESTGKGVAKKLRREGTVPAIVYGGHREAVPITVHRKTLSELIGKSEHGLRSVFLLKMAGTDQQRHAMIKEMQIHPVKRSIDHVDFVRVVMDEVVKVTVPVQVHGTANGVKNQGGMLDFQVRELHVECLPGSIPDAIDIDVSALNVHEQIRVADIQVPEGIKVLDDPDRVVVSVGVTRAEVSAETEVTEEAEGEAEPELIKRGKEEESED